MHALGQRPGAPNPAPSGTPAGNWQRQRVQCASFILLIRNDGIDHGISPFIRWHPRLEAVSVELAWKELLLTTAV